MFPSLLEILLSVAVGYLFYKFKEYEERTIHQTIENAKTKAYLDTLKNEIVQVADEMKEMRSDFKKYKDYSQEIWLGNRHKDLSLEYAINNLARYWIVLALKTKPSLEPADYDYYKGIRLNRIPEAYEQMLDDQLKVKSWKDYLTVKSKLNN